MDSSQEISMEVPVTVCHPLSLLPLPEVLPFDFQAFHAQHLQDLDEDLDGYGHREGREEYDQDEDMPGNDDDGIPVRSCRSLSPERNSGVPDWLSTRSLSPPPLSQRTLPWTEHGQSGAIMMDTGSHWSAPAPARSLRPLSPTLFSSWRRR